MQEGARSDYWDISKLKLWDKNPRSIKDKRFNELKERLKRQGQIKPLLVTRTGIVIGGNMRLRAMQQLGYKNVWVSITNAETDKEIFDLALTDNEEFGYYEQEQLAELAYNIGLTRLELDSYEISLGKPTKLSIVIDQFGPEVEEDEPPEIDTVNEPDSKPGEVYKLGDHRLMCGDTTNQNDLETLMNGVKADMIWTDPPYNVDYEGKTKEALKIQNDKKDDEAFYQFLLDSFISLGTHSKAGAAIYVAHADIEGLNFRKAFKDAGFYLSQCLIWNKNSMVMGRQDYHCKHEPILYGWKEGGGHDFYGGRTQTTVWDIERPTASREHPTMKPLSLIVKAIKNSSKAEDIILDGFLGSGSTLIASDMAKRICYGLELDPRYCDVIRKRYAKHIGEEERWQEVTPALNKSKSESLTSALR